jgi:hypothetical protein
VAAACVHGTLYTLLLSLLKVLDTILVCMSLFTLNLVGQWTLMKNEYGSIPARFEFDLSSVLAVVLAIPVGVLVETRRVSGVSS